jgi:hypothetical protein
MFIDLHQLSNLRSIRTPHQFALNLPMIPPWLDRTAAGQRQPIKGTHNVLTSPHEVN